MHTRVLFLFFLEFSRIFIRIIRRTVDNTVMAAQPPYGEGGGGGVPSPSPSPRGSGGASGGGDFSIEGGGSGAGGGGSSRPRSYLSSVPLVQPAAASRVFRSGYSNVFTVPKHRAGGTQDATGSSNSQAKQPPRRPRGGLGAGAGTYAPPAAAAPPRPRVAPSMANSPNLPPGLAKYGLMPIGEEESLGTSLASSGGSSFNSSIDKSGTTADDLESALQRVAQERERIEQSIAAERVEYDVHRAEVRRRLASVASDHCVAVTASGPGSAKARRLAADVATLAEQLRQEEALSMAQLAREREKWEELLSLEREAAELRLYAMRVELLEADEAEASIRKHGAGASVTMSAETTAMMQQLKQMRRQLRRQIGAAADSGSSTSRSKADSEDSVAHREAKNYARVSSDAANLLLHGPLRSKSHRVGKLVTKASLEGDRPPSPELTPTEAVEASTAIDRKLQEAGGVEKLLNANTTGAGVATAAAGNDPALAMSRRFWTSSRNPNVEPEPATRQEVEAYAVYLGMDIEADRDLLWIAEKALTAPLPSGWVEYLDPEGKEFFYHRESNISSYEHPVRKPLSSHGAL